MKRGVHARGSFDLVPWTSPWAENTLCYAEARPPLDTLHKALVSSEVANPCTYYVRRDSAERRVHEGMLKNGKRSRAAQGHVQSRVHADALSVVDVHDLAYWSQWRLAIHGVCARFEAAAQVEAGAWSRERLDHASVCISKEVALNSEVRHLEAQLGRHTSMNAKLEAALSENAEALVKAESARLSAAAAISRLQVSRRMYVRREKGTVPAENC